MASRRSPPCCKFYEAKLLWIYTLYSTHMLTAGNVHSRSLFNVRGALRFLVSVTLQGVQGGNWTSSRRVAQPILLEEAYKYTAQIQSFTISPTFSTINELRSVGSQLGDCYICYQCSDVTITCLMRLGGIDVCMYILSVYLLKAKSRCSPRTTFFYAAYGGISLLMMTLQLVTNLYYGGLLAIHCDDDAEASSFSSCFTSNYIKNWANCVGVVATAITVLMCDGLMLWRCYVVYTRAVSSILIVVEKTLPESTVSSMPIIGVVSLKIWSASTVAFNVSVTSMICYRLVRMCWLVRAITPERRHVLRKYSGAVSIIVEGTVPYTVLAVTLSAFEFLHGDLSTIVVTILADIWCGVCVVTQQLILLRIAMGSFWNRNTVAVEATAIQSTVVFSGGMEAGRSSQDEVLPAIDELECLV
ncbi:hypothetical protein CONPUDRAFT_144171 [Coniophora puteana RWD-64-598 SS2]|uniref:Uncharacterized protein n=1 Tax=Coniophora puteana (strain RWD-64-598) TaxID=741705 RepID=A0A5M3MQM1_CONPW|nr:uncharacterized protein CONPUDRAFT_144171 [Coniophora puteana RWD-64-598 SS2]EIW81370.1 hypothetical protein CONPUDRAFT_144171 [Coniophora puteana RWD-64-598 SS2]